MLPRIEAERALLLAQVEFLPHLKDASRKQVLSRWETEARGSQFTGEVDQHGRQVMHTFDELAGWLASHGVV